MKTLQQILQDVQVLVAANYTRLDAAPVTEELLREYLRGKAAGLLEAVLLIEGALLEGETP